MVRPRDVLNRILWERPDGTLERVLLFYRHRGAPDDTALVRGEDVRKVGQTFLELPEGVRLPMHRLLRIQRDGDVLWDRARDTHRPETPL